MTAAGIAIFNEISRGKLAPERKTPLRVATIEREVPMQPKTEDAAHEIALAKFVTRLAKEQAKGVKDRGDTRVASVTVHTIPGRKFDRVAVNTTYRDTDRAISEIRYFVNRKTGEIFGAKSRLAPNTNHYFGTLANSDKWDWSGRFGINKTDDTVEVIGRYREFTHYARKIG